MRFYEAAYILSPQIDEEVENSIVEKFSQAITSDGGEVQGIDKWGKKRLAYPVKGFKEGNYIIMRFKSSIKTASEIERLLKLQDEVLKSLLVKSEKEKVV